MTWLLDDLFALPIVKEAVGASPLTYVDVGAAVGVEEPWKTLVSNRPGTAVVAFEPHPQSFEAIAKVSNGRYHQMAIANQNGTARLYLKDTLSSLKQLDIHDDYIEVPVRSLTALREEGMIPSIDILKVDAEHKDFEVILSAGTFLAKETLAVQCEFSFSGGPDEPVFRDFDAHLGPLGFVLFGLSNGRGALGDLYGGNFLYLRSIFHLLKGPDFTLQKGLKLLAIAVATANMQYAYIIVRAMADSRHLTSAQSEELLKLVSSAAYLPDAILGSPLRQRIVSMIGNAMMLVAGRDWRALSSPSSNRLNEYTKLLRKVSAKRQANVISLYEDYYKENSGQ